MKTDDLITMLARDAQVPVTRPATLWMPVAAAAVLSLAFLAVVFGVRHDLATMAAAPLFWLKVGFVAALAAAGCRGAAIASPVDGKWSLAERPGFLRLHALPAKSFWEAKNTLTQRSIGPLSSPTVVLDAAGLKDGDVAGLGLLNLPYATLGVEKTGDGLALALFDQARDATVRVPLNAARVWLRADCDFLREKARFSYSTDGKTFTPIGDEFTMIFQLVTFQGVRYSLFNYNTSGQAGGVADFDSVEIFQPHPRGLMRPIPLNKQIRLASFGHVNGKPAGLAVDAGKLTAGAPTAFTVKDMGLGRVALQSGAGYVTVGADGAVTLAQGKPAAAQSFQWIETPTGELVLMALANNRFLRIDPKTGVLSADSPGALSDNSDGGRFVWETARR